MVAYFGDRVLMSGHLFYICKKNHSIYMKKPIITTILLFIYLSQGFSQGLPDFPLLKIPPDNWQFDATAWRSIDDVVFDPSTGEKIKESSGNAGFASLLPGASIVSTIATQDAKIKFQFNLATQSSVLFYLMGKYPIRLTSLDMAQASGAVLVQENQLILPTERAARASGLWQTCEIVFSAPEKAGGMARIEKVMLNGRTVQQNIFVKGVNPKPSLGFQFEVEKGQFAFKDFEYLSFGKNQPVRLANLSYSIQETYGWDRTFELKDTPVKEGKSDVLTVQIPNDFKEYILTYSGEILVEKTGTYAFTIDYQGVGEFSIDGKSVAGSTEYLYRIPLTGILELKAGKHTFTYKYQRIWWAPGAGLFVSSGDFRPYPLHASNSLAEPDAVGRVFLDATDGKSALTRAFMQFGEEKKTHVMAVGLPEKVNYALDLDQGAPLFAWRGRFADVTDMWHERGEPQLLVPNGITTQLSGFSPFFTRKPAMKWDTYSEIQYKGYQLDGLDKPTFNYVFDSKKVKVSYDATHYGLYTNVSSDATMKYVVDYSNADIQVFMKKVESGFGKLIGQKQPFYLVNNRFVQPIGKTKLQIEKHDGQNFLVGKTGKPLQYSITW